MQAVCYAQTLQCFNWALTKVLYCLVPKSLILLPNEYISIFRGFSEKMALLCFPFFLFSNIFLSSPFIFTASTHILFKRHKYFPNAFFTIRRQRSSQPQKSQVTLPPLQNLLCRWDTAAVGSCDQKQLSVLTGATVCMFDHQRRRSLLQQGRTLPTGLHSTFTSQR